MSESSSESTLTPAAPKPPNKHQARLQAKAESLGVPGNIALAQYVLILEERLETLEAKLGIEIRKNETGKS